MKVHSSLQSSYTSLFQATPNSGSDDDTPFSLPGDTTDDQQQQQQGSTGSASIASAGFSASLSSFWINQANDPTSTSAPGTDGQSSQSIEDEFSDLASMSPAEKIRAQYLQQQGLTEDQFNQLPSDQQKAINDAIAAQIKQQLGDDSKNQQGADDTSDGAAAAVSLG